MGFVFILSLLGLVYAVGFHIADEVLSGKFTGDFEFNGSVNFTNANVSGIGIKLENGKSVSGVSVDFTGIPSGTKKITILLSRISTASNGLPIIQIGDSGGIETTVYDSSSAAIGNTVAYDTTGFRLAHSTNSNLYYTGTITLYLKNISKNEWISSSIIEGDGDAWIGGGNKSLSSELDRIRLTTNGGSDTFDAGTINIQYE